MNYLQQLQTLFRNITLNAMGVERDFLKLLEDKDVTRALEMMQDRHEDVDLAIKEYNPETHEVMNRRDKRRKNMEPYKVEKLPRTRQQYINEIELFFLLGSPLNYKRIEGTDEAYSTFLGFGKDNRLNSLHRTLKRLAGAETEAALVYHLYTENGDILCKPFIAARSTGYDIRPLFDQYGNMLAFAYGYKVKTGKGNVQKWEILTRNFNFECTKGALGGWEVEARENLAHKICAIYAKQQKPWAGVQRRIEREEMIDSKTGDTNNYFADPIAYATADVVNLMGQEREKIGTLLQYTSDKSKFGYVNPPQDSEIRREEKANLAQSILFDSFTPDFSYDSIKGLGSLSGEALENALILGFIKRERGIETYGELFDRDINVRKAILGVMHPELKAEIDALVLEVEFTSPFAKQNAQEKSSIAELYKSGVCSLETAVTLLSLTDTPKEEIEKIKAEQMAILQEANKINREN